MTCFSYAPPYPSRLFLCITRRCAILFCAIPLPLQVTAERCLSFPMRRRAILLKTVTEHCNTDPMQYSKGKYVGSPQRLVINPRLRDTLPRTP